MLPGIVPVIGATEEEAFALAQRLDDLRIPEFGLQQLSSILEVPTSAFDLDGPLPAEVLARPVLEGARSRSDLVIDLATSENLTVRQVLSRLGGGRGHFVQVGTPEQIADTIIHWFENGAADGFNIMAPVLPSGLETFAATVIPILQERGYFHTEYEGETLRDHYGAERPVSQYAPAAELATSSV